VFFMHTTLDGFIATTQGELWERFCWGDEEMAFGNDFFRTADTWVFGRVVYDVVVPWWDAVADGKTPEDGAVITARDREFAVILRGMTKVVVSRTLDDDGARVVIRDNVVDELAALKARPGKDIVLSCGPGLVGLLAPRGLIDEYRVIVHPAVLGTGKHLFQSVPREIPFVLVDATVLDQGCVALRYRPA
jgi:dihydrofolate reductase